MSASTLRLIIIVVVLIVLILALFLPARRRAHISSGAPTDHPSAGPIYRDDNRYWFAGVFYYNPDDPDPFIPKRFGIGWTINFGHPVGKLIAVVIVGMIALPIVLAIFDPGFAATGCHPANCHP